MTRVFAILMLFGWSGFGLAGGAPAKTLTEEDLAVYQKKISDSAFLSVDFTQSRYSALRKKIRKSQGTARFSRPDKFRWQLETPLPDQWIFDGTTLYNYNPDAKQAVKYSPGGKAEQLTQIVDLVMNFNTLLKRYSLVAAHKTGDKVEIELKPKTETGVVRVELHIDEQKNFVSFLKMYLPNGNYTALNFHNPLRSKIDDSVYTLPSGVSVSEGT